MMRAVNPGQVSDWLFHADLHTPFGVSEQRWKQFVEDARAFIRDGWLDKAIKQEWLELELFGCDVDKTFSNRDEGRTGLVLMLAGRSVVGITRDYAVIRNLHDDNTIMQSRALQFQARIKKQKPLVPVWEIVGAKEAA